MKLVAGGILIALALSGCSAKQTPVSQSPLDTKPDTKSDSSFDMCATMPGPDVAKAINVRVTEAKKNDVMRNTCNYTGMTECEKVETMRDLCEVSITYLSDGWLRPVEEGVSEPVPGVGEEAYYDRMLGLRVRVGAQGVLKVRIGFENDNGDETAKKRVDLAKAVLAKL